jgi:PKD repeat protein
MRIFKLYSQPILYVLILFFGLVAAANAAFVERGPYLQMQTDDGIIVHWRTDTVTDSVVRFGTSAGNLSNMATVAGSRLDHAVVLSGLGADQHYWYSVGDSIGTIAGDNTYHFYTAPIQGDPADTRIWVLGDSGTANSDARAVRDAYNAWSGSDPANIVLMLGDNAYNDGTDAQYQSAVFDTYPIILRQLPLWSALGNHDGKKADSATQTGPYYDIFNLPAAGEIGGLASGTEAYYSFDYANIHFICLDSYETDRSVDGAMMTWLENDLAMNTQQPWVVAFWHHPPYSKGSHDSDLEERLIDMREIALPILEDMGVDLVLSGHSHSYERSYLLDGHYGSSLTLDADFNVLNPGDGNDTGDGAYAKPDEIAAARAGAVYAVAGSSGKVSDAPLDHSAMFVSLASLGSLLIDVSGNRMDVVFIDEGATVRDEFTILKGPDLDPPLLSNASAEDVNHVIVTFNEALDATEATNAGNYSIPGLSISTAELLGDVRSVRLTTSAMTSGSSYILVVNNVQDLALNTILSNSQTGFDFFTTMSVSFQDGLEPSPAYAGTSDAYIREATPDTLYGLDPTLQVDGSEPSGSVTDMNIVLGWDISSIPSNATVVTADIQLEVTDISSGPYECYSLLAGWVQTQVTWNSASSGVPWTAPGAPSASDRGTQVACTISAPSMSSLTVNLTADGLSLVESWIADPNSNHGLIIAGPTTSDGAGFHSSESATAMARPKLNITYSVPVTGNNDPVAGFSSSCTNLDCDFSDTSTDSDGTVTAWSWGFGDGNVSSAQNPSHSYTAAGIYTVTLTATDNDGSSDQASDSVTASDPTGFTDYPAIADLPSAGSVSGTFANTLDDDSVIQVITERESGGKKNGRHSYLSHTWRFTVASGSMVTFMINAWSSDSTDGDDFDFAWSTDNSNFTYMFTVSSTDTANFQSSVIPTGGSLYVSVTDTDQTAGHRPKDSISVNQMFIRGDNTVPTDPPDKPLNLQVSSTSSSSISLSWQHDGNDEQSFDLDRSAADSDEWAYLDSTPGGNTSFMDTTVEPSSSYDYRISARNAAGVSSWSNTATGTTPAAASITLSANGYKIKGRQFIDLEWSGVGDSVHIIRDSTTIDTVSFETIYTDNTGNKGGAIYVYKVCNTDTPTCSDNVVVVF